MLNALLAHVNQSLDPGSAGGYGFFWTSCHSCHLYSCHLVDIGLFFSGIRSSLGNGCTSAATINPAGLRRRW